MKLGSKNVALLYRRNESGCSISRGCELKFRARYVVRVYEVIVAVGQVGSQYSRSCDIVHTVPPLKS